MYRIAGAKEKLAGKYKSITDPFVILFVFNYENLIPWADIKPESATDDINKHVNETLLPQLYSKMDKNSTDNNYFKGDFDIQRELQQDPNNDDLQRAYETYLQNPQRGQEFLRECVNLEKSKSFQKWQHNLKADPVFSTKPTFMYALLEKMLKESPANEQNRPTSSRMPALLEVYRTINNRAINPNQQINTWKIYKEKVGDILFADIRHTDKNGSGWKLIPSKDRDPNNFIENKETLMDLSVGHGWCIGKSERIADQYLGNGDFWMYIENIKNVRKPQVAIRMYHGKTGEIRARHNKEADAYAEQIFDLYEVESLNMAEGGKYVTGEAESPFISRLKKAYDGVNKKLESGKLTWKDINYVKYQQLSETNREKMPEEERERVAREFLALGININTNIPPSFENYAFIKDAQSNAWIGELRKNPNVYETPRFPQDLREREDIKVIRFEVWADRIAQNERELETAPADIMNTPAIYNKVVDKMVIKITANPLEYNNISIAMRRGQQRIIDLANTIVIPSIVIKIKQNPMYYDNIAYEFVKNPEIINAFKESYIKLIRKVPAAKNALICKKSWGRELVQSLNKTKEVIDAFKQGLEDARKKRNAPLPVKLQEQPKPQPPAQEIQDDPNLQAKNSQRLVCSSCKNKIQKISKSFHPSEEIYHCPSCDKLGTIDEI